MPDVRRGFVNIGRGVTDPPRVAFATPSLPSPGSAMSRMRSVSSRPLTPVLVLLLALAASLVVAPAAGADDRTPVMRGERVTAAQMAAWFAAHEPSGSRHRASVSIEELASLYVQEGRAEGVAGDVAFVQAILETGWFRWPSGQVTPEHNNFAGIGACDGGTCTVARFPSARIGVRAQIQHLRAYADPTVTEARLANPLVSPRFHLVSPKGRAPYWEQFGGGNWATDPAYGEKILRRYASMASTAVASASGTLDRFHDVSTRDVHANAILTVAERGITQGCGQGDRFCPGDPVTRDQVATFLTRAFDLPAGTHGFADVGGVHDASVGALSAAGITQGCAPARFCPRDGLTRAEMASFLARSLELPAGRATFADVPAGSTHAGAIAALADHGITQGCERGRFCPSAVVSRAQMATFLARAIEH
jgi:hypothetical protein